MKTLRSGRSLLLAILVIGLLILSGCSPCDESGSQQLSAAWAAMPFTVVEGGEVCSCSKYTSCDEYIRIAHKTDNPLELVDKYSKQLKSNGWEVEQLGTSRLSLWATKGDVKLDLFFKECDKTITRPGTLSSCYDLGVTNKSKP